MKNQQESEKTDKPKFVEDVDYYFENGFMVLTEIFLKKRGYCCGNGCRHCPYPKEKSENLQQKSF
ncbi:hypothetical protein BH20ACI1_BH20ACI1_02180 [soil metagenome]